MVLGPVLDHLDTAQDLHRAREREREEESIRYELEALVKDFEEKCQNLAAALMKAEDETTKLRSKCRDNTLQ